VTLPVPNLDDRTFIDLVSDARDRIAQSCPTWTDLSVHDPGMALVEAFAYLTEVLIYRVNQLPEKAHIAFLNLLGVSRHPPAAAWAEVTFTRMNSTHTDPVAIPAGTRIAAARGADPQPAVFVTTEPTVLPADASEVTVRAHHCELVEGELLGVGTGQPGLKLTAARAPIVTTTENRNLLLGVEVPTGTLAVGAVAREHEGRTYEIWRAVASFAGSDPEAKVYQIDRASGVVTFAPALELRGPEVGDRGGAAQSSALAAVPPAGSQIRLWYRVGGGPAGNVAAETLTSLRDPLPGLRVTNQRPARGGRALETVESAIGRGPYEFFSLRRAVTARDFETLAIAGSAAVARARAFTRAAVLSFARPGEVEVVLVPHVPDEARPAGHLSIETLRGHEVDEARRRTEEDLNGRRALGTSCIATWARYKAVSVLGTVVVRPEENIDTVRRRIHDRLYQMISPLATTINVGGWAFGEPLRASNVYRVLEQAEPGVRYVENVRFVVEEVPDSQTSTVAADEYQPDTWYAGCGEVLFRSTNAGQGWEPVGRFPGEDIRRVMPAPAAVRVGIVRRPGAVAVATGRTDGQGSRVYVSMDLGDTWQLRAELVPQITDLAWIDREQEAALLLATVSGLYELSLLPNAVPLQILVDPTDVDRGFYAVRAFVSERGASAVAVAAQARYGVYLSTEGGRRETFRHTGLANVDTRQLTVQYDGPATWLWAGAGEPDPNRPGQGCFRTRLFEPDVRWQALSTDWAGGTCWAIAFAGTTALAATHSGGVLRLDTIAAEPRWQPSPVSGGLPLRDRARLFEPVAAIAVGASGLVLAGGPRGVFRSDDAYRWFGAANRETRDLVTIPDTWLLCSGRHRIEVVPADATPGD
jgi:hypothetical protein